MFSILAAGFFVLTNSCSSNISFNQIFGIKDNDFVDLETGVGKMAKWALDAGPRKTPRFTNIEIFEKLPAIWAG